MGRLSAGRVLILSRQTFAGFIAIPSGFIKLTSINHVACHILCQLHEAKSLLNKGCYLTSHPEEARIRHPSESIRSALLVLTSSLGPSSPSLSLVEACGAHRDCGRPPPPPSRTAPCEPPLISSEMTRMTVLALASSPSIPFSSRPHRKRACVLPRPGFSRETEARNSTL